MGDHVQAGIAACFSIDEYDRDLIKKHEKTRPDKEDDRTRHMLAIGAQTGPVFLTYRASKGVDEVVARVVDERAALRPHRAGRRPPRGVASAGRSRTRRSSMRSPRSTRSTLPMAIIAPLVRRAARVAKTCALRSGAGEHDRVLAVAFPDNQMQVLPYNRVVKDLNGLTPEALF